MKKMIVLMFLAAFTLLAGCLEKPMTLNEAELIARTSSCMAQGNLTNSSFFNNESQTWWIDLDTIKPGCAPACVVYMTNKTAEVNWRCTGLLPQNLTEEEARQIALESDCMKEGGLKNESFYNENSKTWWFDMDVVKPGCNPACVVFKENQSTEINWRCTGLLPINVSECFKPCHIEIGTDYTANPPVCFADVLACTMEYRAGDVCLKYVNCEVREDGCGTTIDPKFSQCITCFEDAAAGKKNQTECEDSYQ